jgi:hypothetical protein
MLTMVEVANAYEAEFDEDPPANLPYELGEGIALAFLLLVDGDLSPSTVIECECGFVLRCARLKQLAFLGAPSIIGVLREG